MQALLEGPLQHAGQLLDRFRHRPVAEDRFLSPGGRPPAGRPEPRREAQAREPPSSQPRVAILASVAQKRTLNPRMGPCIVVSHWNRRAPESLV